ncbi:MAG: hypothetical protein KDK70_18845, partial [Myxococcales bacterium]|nr:hypothetical protein [Myxococcales bacterium]
MSFTARHLLAAAALLCTTFGTGCDLIDAFNNEGSTLVQLMVTHHATPEDGVFPDLSNGDIRTFDNDEGWTVNLRAAFVTTSSASLHECSGGTVAFDNFWGQLPENITNDDLELNSFAAVEVEASSFCSMTVEYGPYTGADDVARMHDMGEHSDEVRGATFYLEGIAQKGDVAVPFEITGTGTASVQLDLSHAMNGGPLTISADEPFPVDLTLSKTYDRFFDGIDFENFDPADIEQNVMGLL